LETVLMGLLALVTESGSVPLLRLLHLDVFGVPFSLVYMSVVGTLASFLCLFPTPLMSKGMILPSRSTSLFLMSVFSDTSLVTCSRKNENAKLHELVLMYAPWIDHVAHDADSDADALRYVTMVVFPKTRAACYVFSISDEEHTTRSGLGLYVPSPIAMFSFSSVTSNTNRRPSSVASVESTGSMISLL
jgi:hypothetical protein